MSVSTAQQDLKVDPISASLKGLRLDVVVSGSIAAVESVRFIRALRRLGAEVTPWLTAGGAQFITPMALSWAAANPVRESFSGESTHIATGDACIVAPASANLIGCIIHGRMDTPAASLIHSYLGLKKPLIFLPTMHDSLMESPPINANLDTLRQWASVLTPRTEEGKQKFPDPVNLADECSHRINRLRKDGSTAKILITMGTTRGYLDDVRYLSNYSSGALGTLISTELYRRGYETAVVCGPAVKKPEVFSKLVNIETNDEMMTAAKQAIADGASAGVFAASVLDYVPATRVEGKVKSGSSKLSVDLNPTEKIIARICENSELKVKVGFKLEADFTAAAARSLAEDYAEKYGLTMVAVNKLSDIDISRHSAELFCRRSTKETLGAPIHQSTKAGLAQAVANHIVQLLND